ncbi:MAG: FAD-dependent oxidoreductase [Acidobacteriota bacterium]
MAARLVVVGAGPMGLAAAVAAIDAGFDVTVLERGTPGEALCKWGPTRFFSPLRMNISERMQELLGESLPDPDALLTGPEMAELVLAPLADTPLLRDRVRSGHRVVAIGRRGLARTDLPNHPLRGEKPFRILVESPSGEELMEAEIVLDASGGHALPARVGAGGVPALGEQNASPALIRFLGDMHTKREDLRGKRILLVGHGHSAANAIVALDELARENPATRVTWAVRTMRELPSAVVANDPLPERQRIVSRANAIAKDPPSCLKVERRAEVESLARNNGCIDVRFTRERAGTYDFVIAMTGYRPDLSLTSELPLNISPISEGGGALHRAIGSVTDCLSTPTLDRADLESGEPGFYFIGSRSYGRSRTFLLQTGLAQLSTIMAGLNP